jgi:hypothetical protein
MPQQQRPPARSTPKNNGAIQCTPDALFKGAAGCIGFLMTLLSVASLSVIAAGVFWTAQQLDKVTDSTHTMLLQMEGFYNHPSSE